jgi:hypothetical protein
LRAIPGTHPSGLLRSESPPPGYDFLLIGRLACSPNFLLIGRSACSPNFSATLASAQLQALHSISEGAFIAALNHEEFL